MSLSLCPRCGLGIDDDLDGDCQVCAHLTDVQLIAVLRELVMARYSPSPLRFRYPLTVGEHS